MVVSSPVLWGAGEGQMDVMSLLDQPPALLLQGRCACLEHSTWRDLLGRINTGHGEGEGRSQGSCWWATEPLPGAGSHLLPWHLGLVFV